MNFKVSLVLIVVLAQIFYTYQTPVQQQRPDDDDDDNEDEYHDNDDKKSVKDNADQIVGAASDLEPPVAEKSANIDETAVNEKPEAEAEPVVNEGVEKSNDEGSEYIEKAQKLLEGNSEVAAEKNSDDEPSLPKTAEVKSPPVEENKEVDTSNKDKDEDVSSNSKPEVDYQEDSDKVNLKLEPSDPKDEEIKDIKEDFKEEVPEVSELQKPAEVRKEIKEPEIDIEPEPEKKVEEEKEGFLKKPEEIRSGEVKKEDTVVNTASVDKQKVVVNVAPDNGKVEEPSPVKQSETGENKQPPKAGKINTFFIIIPGVVLAFVILIVIAFVIFQRTNKSRTDDETATLPTTTDRKPIYQPVPQNANN